MYVMSFQLHHDSLLGLSELRNCAVLAHVKRYSFLGAKSPDNLIPLKGNVNVNSEPRRPVT